MLAIRLFVLFLAAAIGSFGNFRSGPERRARTDLARRSGLDSDRWGTHGSFGILAVASGEIRGAESPTWAQMTAAASSFGNFLWDQAAATGRGAATGRVLAARTLVRRGEFVWQKPTTRAGAIARDTS